MTCWGKTILSVYRHLEKITNAIDKIVQKRAENASGYYGDFNNFNDIFKISNCILDLTERKIRLINLKIICEQALEKMDNNLARILICNYVDNRKCHETVELLGISLRSYFRKQNIALKSFCSTLKSLGYPDPYFDTLLKDEVWIHNIKKSIEDKKEVVFDKNRANRIYNDYKRISYSRQIHSSQTF